ncbi:S8 family serine peptidase [Anaerolineales bacterium HSG24]|nr:S8 family serine peptidase [Anaerolineales bacterium HSG24]
MKQIYITSFFLLLLLFTSTYTQAQTPTSSDDLAAHANEAGLVRVIVRLNVPFQAEGRLSRSRAVDQRATIARAQQGLLRRLNGTTMQIHHQYRYVPSVALTVDQAGLQQLQNAPEVAYIEPDIPEAPALESSATVIGANQAWEMGYSGDGWTVAVLDTGIDTNHPFLQDKVIAEGCFSSIGSSRSLCPNGEEVEIGAGAGINCPADIATCEHGTHVAGIIAGQGEDFSGIAREADLMSMQVYSLFEFADDCDSAPCVLTYPSDQLAALEYIYQTRNDFNLAAVNISIEGGKYTSPCPTNSRSEIIATLTSVDIAVIISAGNSKYNDALASPACIPSAISVGATDNDDQIFADSNSAYFLDFLAPGVDINSSVLNNQFELKSGTSMAAPHVSGAWAVLRSQNPTASIEQIYATLANTGLPITDSRNGLTKPRIQLDAALRPHIMLTYQADDSIPQPSQPLTLTIALTNSSLLTTSGLIEMALPDGLSFVGPVTLINTTGEVAQDESELPTLVSSMIMPPAMPITVTVPMQLQSNLPVDMVMRQPITISMAEMRQPVTSTLVLTVASQPSMTILSTASVTEAKVGEVITYTYYITNAGNVTLTGISAFDSRFGVVGMHATSLTGGQATIGTIIHQVTSTDLQEQKPHTVTVQSISSKGEIVAPQHPTIFVRMMGQVYLPLVVKRLYPFEAENSE